MNERLTGSKPAVINRWRIGREEQPVLILDDFAPNPDEVRAAAVQTPFFTAEQHYPGIRASLPTMYMRTQLPIIAKAMSRTFGRLRRLHVIDASFSIVTSPADALRTQQRLPHVDAYGAERIALVHYLSLHSLGGTAFYRHRSTGYETVDETRALAYSAAVASEIDEAEPAPGYVVGDTPTFKLIERVPARYNRAVLYRSYALHSGAIEAETPLSPDPALGRLTVTGFFAME